MVQAIHPGHNWREGLRLAFPALLLLAISAAVSWKLGPLGATLPADPRLLPATVTIPAHAVTYRAEGSWLREGEVIEPPLITIEDGAALVVMRNEVTVAQYAACVAEGSCRPAEPGSRSGSPNFPVTGVSYDDAVDFAHWLSARTGMEWRLPTIAEWHFLAADEPPEPITDRENARNPALRWIATYEREAALAAAGPARLAPVGSGKVNAFGIADIENRVWEWTSTCVTRVTLTADMGVPARLEACGAHYLEGRHRAEMSNFISDGVTGGCSTGRPPDHLGFRLVRDGSG